MKKYFINKEEKSFEEIYNLYKKDIYSFCFRFFYNQSNAEDVSHEIFISIFKYIESFNPQKGSFRSWIFKISYHACCKFKKDYIPSLIVDEIESFEKYSKKEDLGNYIEMFDLEKALNNLKEEYRTPIILTKLRGFSIKESSSVLSISENNVKQRVYRGMKLLKQYLEEG